MLWPPLGWRTLSHPTVLLAQSIAQSRRWHYPQEGAGDCWGCCSPLHRKTLGAGNPWGFRADRWLDSGWVGGSRSQGKRAPPWGLGPQEITIITK